MRRTEWLQDTREMRFEEVYFGWSESWLSQEEAARVLGVSDRTFRRYINRYEETGDSGVTVGSRTRFRQGEQDTSHPVRTRHETLGDSDDRSLFSGSPRAQRTGLFDPPRPTSQGVGS